MVSNSPSSKPQNHALAGIGLEILFIGGDQQGLLIILWTWRHARRFGAILPEPNLERRSLLEHIDASARWAWTTAMGRQNLLDAARAACKESLRRRAPELLRLNTTELIQN